MKNMGMRKTLADIEVRLKANGLDGLYSRDGCCCASDLAPCGQVKPSINGWINGCSAGYQHGDPRSYGDWIVSKYKGPITNAELDFLGY